MPLEWNVNNTDSPRYLHQAVCNKANEAAIADVIKDAIDGSIERAIDCLHENIKDDSLYFLVEWDDTASTLTIIVTDDSKQKESPHKIVSDFSDVMSQLASRDNEDNEVDIDKIQYWVRDFLTTSTGFIRFSLVAIFSRGDRSKTILM